jgi:hypothetical protein
LVNCLSNAGSVVVDDSWFVIYLAISISLVESLGNTVLSKPTLRDCWNFTKATYSGSFYSLFFLHQLAVIC